MIGGEFIRHGAFLSVAVYLGDHALVNVVVRRPGGRLITVEREVFVDVQDG